MSETTPRSEESPVEGAPRNPIGWIVLGLLLLFAVYGTVAGFSQRHEIGVESSRLGNLRTTLVIRELSRRYGVSDGGLDRLERELASRHKADAESAVLLYAVRTELGRKTAKADLAPALVSSRDDLRTIAQTYALPPTSPTAAAGRLEKLDARGPLSRLAATHLREAKGLPGARDWIRVAADRYVALFILVGVVGFGSLVAWAALLIAAANGSVPNLGPPDVAHSPRAADGLAIRAALLFFGFEVVSYAFRALDLSAPVKTILSGATMFAVVPLVLRGRPSFEEIVGARAFLGRKVLLGLWAFLLEIPVTLLVASFGGWLFRGLPQNEHPAATALMNTHDPLTIASLLFFGAVVAPFWEETMFRGLVFPGLRRLLSSPIAGAVLSSFLFACIHPQGPGGWLGLMAFALCSCVLVGRTRSLVPSMAMHAAHNAVLLTLAVLMAG